MSKHTTSTIPIVVHMPKTSEAQQVLAQRVAEAHARMARVYIEDLRCPAQRKTSLAKAVVTAMIEKEPVS